MKLLQQHHSKPFSLLLLWLVVGVQARNGGHGGQFDNLFGLEQQPAFVNKTCDASFACPLNRRHDEQDEQGTFVCRTTYYPVSGASQTRAMCIPADKGLESDDCGCCGESCPSPPEFQEITCDGQEDLLATVMRNRGGYGGGFHHQRELRRGGFTGDGGGDRQGGGGGGHGGGFGGTPAIVCRELYNPFTGVLEPTTMPIDSTKSLDGDVCGCCDGVCPDEISREPFERPTEVELTWCAAEQLTSCTMRGKHHHFQDGTDQDEEGVFVCRSRTDPLTGTLESQTICISTDEAWETDQCGCCDQGCPETPITANLDCPADQACDRRHGQTGVFVCRSLYHPLQGDLVETTLCVEEDETWATDVCGCCDASDCPTTPSDGFEDQDTQIMSFAMSAAGDVSNAANEGASVSGVPRYSIGTMATGMMFLAGIAW